MIKRLALISSLLLTTTAYAQWDDVTVEAAAVNENIYMLTGRGGNIGLSIGPDGAFIIDDQYAPLSDKVKAAIEAIDQQAVRFVINTHWHGDHTGGNENFAKQGSVIVAHDNVRKRMSTDQSIRFFNADVPAADPIALPIITYDRGLSLHLNGDTANVYHVRNAHTDGDSIVFFENANVLHMGDIFFNGMYPFIDIGSGGSIQGMISAVEYALQLTNTKTKIIPGHGPLASTQDMRNYLNMLRAGKNSVEALFEAEKTVDEIIALKPTEGTDGDFGQGFIQPEAFVRFIYQSLENAKDQ